MTRQSFLRNAYRFITSAGVVSAGATAATIYLGKKYKEENGHHHPYVQKFHNYIKPFAQDLFPSPRVTKTELDELPYYLVEDRVNSSAYLKALLFACKLSGTRPSEFVISILDDKMPVEDILGTIEYDNEIATSRVALYDNPTISSLNLAHIAAMSNRKSEEKTRIIELLQQKGVDIDAKGPVGETVHDICPGLILQSFKRPGTEVGGSKHETLKEDSYFPSI